MKIALLACVVAAAATSTTTATNPAFLKAMGISRVLSTTSDGNDDVDCAATSTCPPLTAWGLTCVTGNAAGEVSVTNACCECECPNISLSEFQVCKLTCSGGVPKCEAHTAWW